MQSGPTTKKKETQKSPPTGEEVRDLGKGNPLEKMARQGVGTKVDNRNSRLEGVTERQ